VGDLNRQATALQQDARTVRIEGEGGLEQVERAPRRELKAVTV